METENNREESLVTGFFNRSERIPFEGILSDNPLAFRYFNASETVLGMTLENQLQLCAGPTQFALTGLSSRAIDDRPVSHQALGCFGDSLEPFYHGVNRAFELFRLLGLHRFSVSDSGLVPESSDFRTVESNISLMRRYLESRVFENRQQLQYGVVDLQTHRRFIAGSALNPDPDVFAYAAARTRLMMDLVNQLSGEGILLQSVLRGQRALLNDGGRRTLSQLGTFLYMVVEYKHRIGYSGRLLLETSSSSSAHENIVEGVAGVYGLLKEFGLEREFHLMVRPSDGRHLEGEVSQALMLNCLGGLDLQETDAAEKGLSVRELALTYYQVLLSCGLSRCTTWINSNVHPHSLEPDDQLMASIGHMDRCARAFKAAVDMYVDRTMAAYVEDRFSGWLDTDAQLIMSGELSLEDLTRWVKRNNGNPQPESGRLEYLQNQIDRFI